jgi:succinate dehydrogenase/fumarate reductase cytochrome b subunit
MMAKKSVNFYLIKTVRISGWILFFIMLLFVSTGFALCGKFGFARVISTQKALTIHKVFDVPLIFFFLVHSLVGIYFALRRWGWIKKRKTA